MRQRKYTQEVLEPVVKQSYSFAQVLRTLKLQITGGNYRSIRGRIREYGLDTSHFTGALWSKGKTALTDKRIRQVRRYSNKQVFAENSPITNGTKLKQRLLELGWEYCCYLCRLLDWLGNPITFHLDHINGDSTDNRFENLRFLCPNCHQQTDTWGSKNR